MSLLLQALQKASQENSGSAEDTDVATDKGQPEDLALQPLDATGESTGTGPARQPVPAESTASERSASPQDAADFMRASEAPAYSVFDWARDHYMLTIIGGAILFAIFYGLYVYLQVSHPGLLRSSPPVAAPIQTSTPAPEATPRTPKVAGLPVDTPAQIAEPADEAALQADTTAQTESTAPVEATTKTAAQAAPQASRAPQPPRSASRPARVTSVTDRDGVEVVEIPPSPSVTQLPGRKQVAAASDIRVEKREPDLSRIDAMLMTAYEAMQGGQHETADKLYKQVLAASSDNIDAMLGIAAIEWSAGKTNRASDYYARVLELDPRNMHAQAGLVSIVGTADPVAAESKLKQLIAKEASGFLYFSLGNLYAEQAYWSQAQAAYFQAFQLEPERADYAFNLAVGLEHLGQARPALDYYRKALDLSFRNGRAHFDQALAIERVGQLSARVE